MVNSIQYEAIVNASSGMFFKVVTETSIDQTI